VGGISTRMVGNQKCVNCEENPILTRCKGKWDYRIRMDVTKTACEDVDWMYVAQDRGPFSGCCGYGN
jgi:hypothetical protein